MRSPLNATEVRSRLMLRRSFRESTPMTQELKLRRALKRNQKKNLTKKFTAWRTP